MAEPGTADLDCPRATAHLAIVLANAANKSKNSKFLALLLINRNAISTQMSGIDARQECTICIDQRSRSFILIA